MSAAEGSSTLPDAAGHDLAGSGARLDRVGMAGIDLPVRLHDPATGGTVMAPARADAGVDLVDPSARGIHMSRLYLTLQAMLAEEELGMPLLHRVLQAFLGSHQGLSRSAWVSLGVDQLVKRPALISANAGWRAYPVRLGALSEHGQLRSTVAVEVLFSSTCPASSALARHAQAERWRERFGARASVGAEEVARWLEGEEAVPAVAHSQRSRARVEVALVDPTTPLTPVELIDGCERALGTAVQAAVKREDELEFARRAATHLMFCEDSARALVQALSGDPRLCDWRIEVAHLESLHAHDAIAAAAKGVPGGFRA